MGERARRYAAARSGSPREDGRRAAGRAALLLSGGGGGGPPPAPVELRSSNRFRTSLMPERTFVISRPLVALAALLLVGARADAQGTLAGQGFGFAPGQLSTRALGSGGATALFDAHSPINPAALGRLDRTTIFLQYEPEFRQVRLDDASDGSRLIRYPVAFVAFPVSQRLTIALSSSTLLDRTWTSRFEFTLPVTDGTAEGSGTFASAGAMNDVRLGAAWALSETFRVGAGAHAITGQNRLAVNGVFTFPDSLGTAPLSERS